MLSPQILTMGKMGRIMHRIVPKRKIIPQKIDRTRIGALKPGQKPLPSTMNALILPEGLPLLRLFLHLRRMHCRELHLLAHCQM